MAESVSPKKPSYSNCAQVVHHQDFSVMLLEPRPFRPFKSSEEYLYAMKEDLAEWLNTLYELDINADTFLHANQVLKRAREYEASGRQSLNIAIPVKDVVYRMNVKAGTFPARDNVSNFITWCRLLQIHECLLFETEDLVMRKNEKSFILCLLEVARRGSKIDLTVVELLSRCSCPTQYSLEYISDGKYRIGDTKVLIFVRILRSHVMVRVGGGWY
ncbi:unnamed protein product, partial [Medioppia subpectinata]